MARTRFKKPPVGAVIVGPTGPETVVEVRQANGRFITVTNASGQTGYRVRPVDGHWHLHGQ